MHVTVIIAAAGEGRRLGAAVPKQLLEIDGQSILERSVSAFVSHQRISDVIVVLPPALAAAPPDWMAADAIRVVAGGSRRQDSVANAFDRLLPESDVILVQEDISRDIFENLRLKLNVEEKKQLEAYRLYLKGRNAWRYGSFIEPK